MAGRWPFTVAAVGDAPRLLRIGSKDSREAANALWHEAMQVWDGAGPLRRRLREATSRGTRALAGIISVPRDAALVLVSTPLLASADAAAAAHALLSTRTVQLFGGATAESAELPRQGPDITYTCNWRPADSGLLEDIAAVMSPLNEDGLEARLQVVVHASTAPLPHLLPSTAGTHRPIFAYLAVVFGAVAGVAVRASGARVLRWDAAGAGDDAGTAGDDGGRVLVEALAAVRLRKAAWVAWECADNMGDVVVTPCADGGPPLIAVYSLHHADSPAPASQVDDTLSGTHAANVSRALAGLAAYAHEECLQFGYHLRYPVTPVEAEEVGSAPVECLLRGVDLAAATAAIDAGYTVEVGYCWVSAEGCTTPQAYLSTTPPTPLPFTGPLDWDIHKRGTSRRRTCFDSYYTVPDGVGFASNGMVWLNHPQHLDPGVIHDVVNGSEINFSDTVSGRDASIVGLVGTVLFMHPASETWRELRSNPTRPEVQSLQAAVERALTTVGAQSRLAFAPAMRSVPMWYERRKPEAASATTAAAVPPDAAAAVALLAASLAAPVRSLWYTANTEPLPAGGCVMLAFPGGALRFPPPHGTPDLAAYLAPLMAACAPAAFGRGTESVLDPAVRRAWALPAAALATNWHPASAGVLARVQRALGASMPPLRATLGKANVYGPGDFFHAHADTLRCDTMVGTLVVCLPCAHTGGDLVLRHDGVTERTAWGTEVGSSAVQWAAFYSDVLHEVEPVTSGYRVTLTYDLYADTSRHVAGGERVEYGTDGQLAVVPRALPATAVAACPLAAAAVAAATNPARWSRGGYMGIFASHAYPITSAGSVDAKLLKGADALVWRALYDAGCHPRLHPVLLHLPGERLPEWRHGGMNAIFVGAQAALDEHRARRDAGMDGGSEGASTSDDSDDDSNEYNSDNDDGFGYYEDDDNDGGGGDRDYEDDDDDGGGGGGDRDYEDDDGKATARNVELTAQAVAEAALNRPRRRAGGYKYDVVDGTSKRTWDTAYDAVSVDVSRHASWRSRPR